MSAQFHSALILCAFVCDPSRVNQVSLEVWAQHAVTLGRMALLVREDKPNRKQEGCLDNGDGSMVEDWAP